MDIQLKKGLMEICVLAILRGGGESYGYKIEEDIAPVIQVSENSLYPILKRLQNEELVLARSQEHNGRIRKYYKITDKGKQQLLNHLGSLDDMKKVASFILKKVEEARAIELGVDSVTIKIKGEQQT